jgi:hypothetical protein
VQTALLEEGTRPMPKTERARLSTRHRVREMASCQRVARSASPTRAAPLPDPRPTVAGKDSGLGAHTRSDHQHDRLTEGRPKASP